MTPIWSQEPEVVDGMGLVVSEIRRNRFDFVVELPPLVAECETRGFEIVLLPAVFSVNTRGGVLQEVDTSGFKIRIFFCL